MTDDPPIGPKTEARVLRERMNKLADELEEVVENQAYKSYEPGAPPGVSIITLYKFVEHIREYAEMEA